jgi:hypothetical protein
MSDTFDFQTIVHKQYVGMCTIYLHITIHVPNFSVSLVIATKS